jgi:hypothetical protein
MNPHGITAAAAVVTAVAAALGAVLVRGTTAAPAAIWAVAASLGLAIEASCTEAGWLAEAPARAASRLVIVSLAVCPVMSILGAKRPQHGVWQFIVATLAFVLAMPAVTAVLVRPGSIPDLHMIERVFLPLLVGVGWMNYVATRRSLAASLVSAGQIGLMWAYVPLVGHGEPLAPNHEALAALLIAAGAVLAGAQAVLWPVTSNVSEGFAASVNPPFLALRETLGAAWTLRIAERFNTVAAERAWPCRMRFAGAVVDPDAIPGCWEEEARRCLRSLLRRFVSVRWLRQHAGSDRSVAGSVELR